MSAYAGLYNCLRDEQETGAYYCQVSHFTLVFQILKFLCLRQSHATFPNALILGIPEVPLFVSYPKNSTIEGPDY